MLNSISNFNYAAGKVAKNGKVQNQSNSVAQRSARNSVAFGSREEVVRVAVNAGLGTIGKQVIRQILEMSGTIHQGLETFTTRKLITPFKKDPVKLELVAVNLTRPRDEIGVLKGFELDSLYGNMLGGIKLIHDGDNKFIQFGKGRNAKIVRYFEQGNIVEKGNNKALPWKDLDIDVVIDASGVFKEAKPGDKSLAQHLEAGAKRAIVTAPGKDMPLTVFGINHHSIKADDRLVSTASCTTNALSPISKLLDMIAGIKNGLFVTVHGPTNSQSVLDATVPAGKDFRKYQQTVFNGIPTTTGAAKALGKVIPNLAGKMDGQAIRVEMPISSIYPTINLEKSLTPVQIREAVDLVSKELPYAIIRTPEGAVAQSILGRREKAIIIDDMIQTVNDGKTVMVPLWYDNNAGYVNNVVNTALNMGKQIHGKPITAKELGQVDLSKLKWLDK